MLNADNIRNATVNAKLITLVRFARECGWAMSVEFGMSISQHLSHAWKDADVIWIFQIVESIKKCLSDTVGMYDRIEKLRILESAARTEQGWWS